MFSIDPRKVLLVESEPSIQVVVSNYLRMLYGCDVVTQSSVEGAIFSLQQNVEQPFGSIVVSDEVQLRKGLWSPDEWEQRHGVGLLEMLYRRGDILETSLLPRVVIGAGHSQFGCEAFQALFSEIEGSSGKSVESVTFEEGFIFSAVSKTEIDGAFEKAFASLPTVG
ncbi:hypothetical protein JW710_05075 [Candidatus Dojkabacteria bacterium]|nr:hypothetical protein [Candidatus Dojkabacteria bacterium]